MIHLTIVLIIFILRILTQIHHKFRHNLFSHLFSFQVIKKKRLNTEWHCACCLYPIHDDEVSIDCDRCLNWFHLRCTNMKNVPKSLKDWFCKYCSSNSASVCQGKLIRSTYEWSANKYHKTCFVCTGTLKNVFENKI